MPGAALNSDLVQRVHTSTWQSLAPKLFQIESKMIISVSTPWRTQKDRGDARIGGFYTPPPEVTRSQKKMPRGGNPKVPGKTGLQRAYLSPQHDAYIGDAYRVMNWQYIICKRENLVQVSFPAWGLTYTERQKNILKYKHSYILSYFRVISKHMHE